MLDGVDFTTNKKPRRRKRDPDGTRSAILEAAGKLLARDGPEGLSVSQVAQLAGVNRGTAYQHFPTREQLLEATAAWVGEKLRLAVFGGQMADPAAALGDPKMVAEQMTAFAMENPELGRVWLFEVLSSSRPDNDPFWHQYWTQFEKFAKSDMAQPGIDAEVHSVLMLLGTFLWPVFARSQTRTAKDRQELAQRFSNEILRWSLYGTMRPEKYPELDARVKKAAGTSKRSR
ncbi:MAG TPA: TetR/AcrR family transcriptional regulator [Solimonas sp.]|nr:TetR/AcrR family transcriptional regulator [Solimonas sp.]